MTLHRLSAAWVLGVGLAACAGERPEFGSPRTSGDASDATASDDDAAVDTTAFDETDSDSSTASDDTGTTSTDSTADSTSNGDDTTSSDDDSTDTSTSNDPTTGDPETTSTGGDDSTSDDLSQTDSTDTDSGSDDASTDDKCGNGTVEGTEACDDGNPADGDGCTACAVDTGWTCTSEEPSQCEPPAPPVITSFVISTDQLPGGGGEVTLSWEVTGADTVRIEAEGADDLGEVTGQLSSVNVDRSSTFTLIAKNAGGTEERTRAVEVTSKGTEAWYVQFGTTETDQANAIATDADGNVFVVGDTSGSLGGNNQGGVDTFVSKYTATKELKWHRQLGTEQYDYGLAVATDANGAVFVAGHSSGDLLGGGASLGTLFLAKYTDNEQPVWVRQFGEGEPHDVTVAPIGDVYVVGANSSGPRHLTKYSNDGEFVWTEVVQPSYDVWRLRVAADATGDAFLAGYGYDQRNGAGDWFVSKYRDQETLWPESFPFTSVGPHFVDAALNGSGELMLLSYGGGLNPDLTYISLARYSSDGDDLGTTQVGADYQQLPTAMAVDPSDNVLVTGSGILSQTGTGPLFIGKYDGRDELQWASQLSGTQATGVAAASNGMVFVIGTTDSLASNDSSDAFIAAFR